MNFPAYTVWFFALILLLLAFLALYPTPMMIGVAVMASSVLIIYQTFLILKDQPTESTVELRQEEESKYKDFR